MDDRMGMNEVYSPPPEQVPVANVVFVHGLFGGSWKTWAAKSKGRRDDPVGWEEPASTGSSTDAPSNSKQKPPKHVFWPRCLLPLTVENVRVYSFGYDADVEKFMSSAGLNTVHQHGRNLFNELHALRRSQVPTIIVAHSLGGLVVKEALNQAAHSAHQDEKEVVSNMSGIVFLGTPHRGSNAASYGRIAYLLTKTFAFQSANTKLLTALEKNSETLDRISTEFFHTLESYKNLRIASFSEEKQIRFGVIGMQIVQSDSAKIGHIRETWGSISEDHRNMAKYASLRDEGFVKVSRKIKEWVDDAQKTMCWTDLQIYEECLKSLDDPIARFRVQNVDPVRDSNKNTFEWLFTDQVPFSRWLSDDSGEFDALFWVTGKPGSGKSTLMRFALEDSRTMSLQPSGSKSHPMAYFFHLRGKSLVQKSLRGMLMELVYQLLERFPTSFKCIRPIFLKLRRLKQDWDIRSLSEALFTIPRLPPNLPGCRDRVTIFVDALDENQNQNENSNLLSIFDNLNDIYMGLRDRPDAPVLKICLASRRWPIFRKQLGDNLRVPSFAIQDFTAEDIRQYTTTHIVKAVGERQRAISQLSTDIAARAQGVFIWVRVVVDNLRQEIIDGTPVELLRQILHQYPMELDDMYKLTLKRIAPAYRPESLILFKIMLASRVPFTAFGVYTCTYICQGNPPPDDGPTESLDGITTWLASRSGGLIDVVDTVAREARCGASGSDEEATLRRSPSNPLDKSNPQVEFLHQTVEEFVRKSLNNTLQLAQTESSVAQGSGSRLLALACLDSHPPHHYLRIVAKDIFTYLREVEREEEDDTQSQQPTTLPHWGSYDLHDFPYRIRDLTNRFRMVETTSEILSYYLEPNDPLTQMVLGKRGALFDASDLWNEEVDNWLAPNLVRILHNLYRTKGSAPIKTAEFPHTHARIVCNILLLIASVGPRLSNERVDRPRMFQHVLLATVSSPLWKRLSSPPHALRQDSSVELAENSGNFGNHIWSIYRPVVDYIDKISIPELPTDLIRLFACLRTSTEVDENTLLGFAESLAEYPVQFEQEYIAMEIPITSTQGPDDRKSKIRRIRMTPTEFCSRFRQTNLEKWVELFLRLENSPHALKHDVESQAFLDLAVYDAMNQEPPQHAYTRLANLVEWDAERRGPLIGQVIASACIPAAVVGLGGKRILRAFYEGDYHNRSGMVID